MIPHSLSRTPIMGISLSVTAAHERSRLPRLDPLPADEDTGADRGAPGARLSRPGTPP